MWKIGTYRVVLQWKRNETLQYNKLTSVALTFCRRVVWYLRKPKLRWQETRPRQKLERRVSTDRETIFTRLHSYSRSNQFYSGTDPAYVFPANSYKTLLPTSMFSENSSPARARAEISAGYAPQTIEPYQKTNFQIFTVSIANPLNFNISLKYSSTQLSSVPNRSSYHTRVISVS